MNIDEKIEEWEKVKTKMKYIKEYERKLRIEIGNYFDIASLPEGTTRKQTENYDVELKHRFNYKISEVEYLDVIDEMNDEEKACIKTSYSLLKNKYNALADKSIIDDCILITDSLLGIEVVKKEQS